LHQQAGRRTQPTPRGHVPPDRPTPSPHAHRARMTTNALWDLLRCPACGSRLEATWYDDDEGLLRSTCGLWFPIVRGIPRIFVGEMRIVYRTDFADFLVRRGLSDGNVVTSDETRAKLATRESFGFEWTHFAEMLPEWEKNAQFYFEPLGPRGLS